MRGVPQLEPCMGVSKSSNAIVCDLILASHTVLQCYSAVMRSLATHCVESLVFKPSLHVDFAGMIPQLRNVTSFCMSLSTIDSMGDMPRQLPGSSG